MKNLENVQNTDFDGVPYCRKVASVKARPAVEGEVHSTVVKGKVETTNTAKAGDWIAIGVLGEITILTSVQFFALHDPSTDTKPQIPGFGTFTTRGVIQAKRIKGPFKLLAPWGKEQIIQDGYLFKNHTTGEVYGCEETAFYASYEWVNKQEPELSGCDGCYPDDIRDMERQKKARQEKARRQK